MAGHSYTSLLKTLDNPSSTQTDIPGRGPIKSSNKAFEEEMHSCETPQIRTA